MRGGEEAEGKPWAAWGGDGEERRGKGRRGMGGGRGFYTLRRAVYAPG